MSIWVLEYTHRHGTDIVLCSTEEDAKITALDLFLDNWRDFEDRKQGPKLREAVKYIAQQIVAKDVEGAVNRLITVLADEDQYGYDEGFSWYERNTSQASKASALVENAINTINWIEEEEEDAEEGE